MADTVVRCRCGHLWTVHEEGRCHSRDDACDCTGFYPDYWRPNRTDTCRGCGHDRARHPGGRCQVPVGEDTVTVRHFGFEGDTWTTRKKIDVLCRCASFW